MLVVQVFGKPEHHPAPVFGTVHVCRAPALEGVDLGGHRSLVGVRAGGAKGLVAVEQVASQLRHRHLLEGGGFSPRLATAKAIALRVGLHERMILGGRGDVGAAFQQGQGTAADEVDLEPEQGVVGARRRDQLAGLVTYAEESRDETAHVWSHRHHEIAARHRSQRLGHLAVLLPLRPQLGFGRLDRGHELVVQVAQAARLVQVGEGESGNSEGGIRYGVWCHCLLSIICDQLWYDRARTSHDHQAERRPP